MKNIFYKLIAAGCLIQVLLLTPACNGFEPEPLNWNTEDRVLNPADSTANSGMKGIFNAIYLSLPTLHNRLQNSYLDAATDDGVATKDQGGSGSLENYRNGLLSPGNIDYLDGNAWDRNYTGIRRANLFLRSIQGYPASTQLPAERIVQMKAEARLLRAYYYIELIKRWGGVPLLGDQVLGSESDANIPRSPLEECVEYILSEISPNTGKYPQTCYYDLHIAQSGKEVDEPEYGRVNQGVALALISRMKLYLASPLYDDASPLVGYKIGDPNKWKDAADAAKALIDLDVYALATDPVKQFAMNSTDFPNKEMIFLKEMASNSSIETQNSPVGYFYGSATAGNAIIASQGSTSPSQNLVDAFLTLDGKTIDDPTSEYNEQAPYANRDPRLARTVFINGTMWLKRAVQTFDGGLDRSLQPNMSYTQTGYYLRKFLGDNANTDTYTALNHHVQLIRYAEILLNYAEALNEYAPSQKNEIEAGIIALRKRAGIKAGSDSRYGLPTDYSQAEMRKIIHNERRIELAYEDHRFWDIRRWKIADQEEAVMLQPVRGVNIIKQEDGAYRYEYGSVRRSTFSRQMYWYPIPRGEMQGNNKLVQNPGWNY
ncbi:MAG: RagB/SusD family nutrient uptake outer membrane protein [Candidatus Symbiothrix sp.]|jgi:hypothetical protein|nr:RagB/SusD family nutrient uptake outer membrane protein [Candidatus Symbiothrix sp.]